MKPNTWGIWPTISGEGAGALHSSGCGISLCSSRSPLVRWPERCDRRSKAAVSPQSWEVWCLSWTIRESVLNTWWVGRVFTEEGKHGLWILENLVLWRKICEDIQYQCMRNQLLTVICRWRRHSPWSGWSWTGLEEYVILRSRYWHRHTKLHWETVYIHQHWVNGMLRYSNELRMKYHVMVNESWKSGPPPSFPNPCHPHPCLCNANIFYIPGLLFNQFYGWFMDFTSVFCFHLHTKSSLLTYCFQPRYLL